MKTVIERLTKFRSAMENRCDLFIMPSSDAHSSEYAPEHDTAWEYFSGFSCENSNLIIAQNEAAMWVDGRFFGAADKALKDTGIKSMHMGVKGVPTVHEWLHEKLESGMILGYNAETMPLTEMRSLQNICEKKGAILKDLPLVDEVWTEDRAPLPSSPAWILDKKYSGEDAAQKLSRFREKVAKEKADAMLVTKLDSLAWLLNLRAADVDCTPYALAFCYVDMDKAVLFMDYTRLAPEAVNEYKNLGIELQGYKDMPAYIASIDSDKKILIDPTTLNASLNNALVMNKHCTVIEGKDPIALMKAVKNETELTCIRRSHLRDGVAMVRYQMELEKALKENKPLRETSIDPILHKYRSNTEGFLTESFPTIAAYGPNGANMHYAPKAGADAALEHKGFLLVDSGATYYEGTTDITRTYTLGELTEEERLAYTRVLRCHIDIAMAVWKAGATGGELDMIARQPLWRHMLDYRCGTGHGVAHVGAVHEGPQSLRPHNDVEFVPGMIITDEPGLYEEGSFGIRIETELECIEAGESDYGKYLCFRPIMYVPVDMTPVIVEELTKEERQWINNYHAHVLEKLTPMLNEEEVKWLTVKCAAI